MDTVQTLEQKIIVRDKIIIKLMKLSNEKLPSTFDGLVNFLESNSADVWHSDYMNVKCLAKHLIDTYAIQTPEEMLAYMEKPWKWNAEWEEYKNKTIKTA